MPRLLPTKCPQCGAVIDLAPRVEVVECAYCRRRSIVDWGDRGPTPRPAEPDVGRVVAPAPAPRPALAWRAGVAVLVAGVVAAVTLAALRGGGRRAGAPAPPRAPAIPAIPPIPGRTDRPPPVALEPRLVDGAELVRRAVDAVGAEAPEASLVGATFSHVVGGLVDAARDDAGFVRIAARLVVPGAPPGADVAFREYRAVVHRGALSTSWMASAAPDDTRPVEVPTCPTASAWAAAVGSGVPADAVATFYLYFNGSFTPRSPTVWSIHVAGHDEHRREIDARTCAVVADGSRRR